jgi:hypothetical protein
MRLSGKNIEIHKVIINISSKNQRYSFLKVSLWRLRNIYKLWHTGGRQGAACIITERLFSGAALHGRQLARVRVRARAARGIGGGGGVGMGPENDRYRTLMHASD